MGIDQPAIDPTSTPTSTRPRRRRPLLVGATVAAAAVLIAAGGVWWANARSADPAAIPDATSTSIASPTPTPTPIQATGVARPAACDDLYSDSYVEYLESYGDVELRLNRTDYDPWEAGASSRDGRVSNVQLMSDRLSCQWFPPPTNIGVTTTVIAVSPQTREEMVALLGAGGATCETVDETTECDAPLFDSEYAIVREWHVFQDGLWVSATLTNADPEGYRDEVLANIFRPDADRAPLPADEGTAAVDVPASCDAAYPTETVAPTGERYAEDPDAVVEDGLVDGLAGLLGDLGGLRCVDPGGSIDPAATAWASVDDDQGRVVLEQLESAGAACTSVRGGVLCTLQTDEIDGISTAAFVGGGVWIVQSGGDAGDILSEATDVLFGPLDAPGP